MKTRYILGMIVSLICLSHSYANNIQISNVSLTGQDTVNNTYQVQFDISWENSWRTSTFESNYDAAWIFIKFREEPETIWQHAKLQLTGFVAPAGSDIDVSNDTIGAFLFRSTDGIGNVSFASVELQWKYGASSVPDDAVIEICIFAVEMVFIPGGSYLLGDNSNSPFGNFEAGNTNSPFAITSENSITLGGTDSANLSNNDAVSMITADDYNYSTTQTLPAAYPKGFNAFYVQKYEMSQGQYAAFLNKLTPVQASSRFPDMNGMDGHTIDNTGPPPEIYTVSAPDRACNHISWSDIAAYADWSGLRPMSELEYEKGCRGPRPPAIDEYAWGNAYLIDGTLLPYTFANAGLPNETVSNPGVGTGNAIYSPVSSTGTSPHRCGIFAASAITLSRQETGASYYGVMEMSGNVYEMSISTGNSIGRSFQANHGDGIISITGDSNVNNWPNVTGAMVGNGVGIRGGGYTTPSLGIRISHRQGAAWDMDSGFNYFETGGRLVRSAF
jgi:Sulfatase-modifying factor enzyme 1